MRKLIVLFALLFNTTVFAQPPAPPIPTGLTATTASGTQINLHCNSVAGASAYRFLRSLVTTGPYAQVGLSATVNFSNTGLANSTMYYYVVQSYNGSFSANSSEASATTTAGGADTGIPNAPTTLTPSGSATISWTASTGSAVYHYTILRSATSGTETAIDIVGGSTVTYTDGSPLVGAAYYVVTATGSVGTSPASNEVSFGLAASPTFNCHLLSGN